jgi:unsaturated rhamnogalacturonyl hydrolase
MRSAKVIGLLPCAIMAFMISPFLGGCSVSPSSETPTGGTTSVGGSGAGGSGPSGGKSGSGGATGSGGESASGGSGSGGSTVPKGGGGSPKMGGSQGNGGSIGATGGVGAGGVGNSCGSCKSGGTGGGTMGLGGMKTDSGAGGDGGIDGGGSGNCPTSSEFGTWTSGKGPADIGPLAVESFKPQTNESYGGDGYAWTFTYVGSLQFTKLTGDTTNNDFLIGKFDCNQQGPDNSASASVDTRAFGDLPLEVYLEAKKDACKTLGMARADAQWKSTTSDGITTDARYWIDDMYMITSLQVWAYRVTKDTKYLDRAAKTMLAYIAALQQSDGLFWHTKQSKAYWGRANGWVASGMTELLLELPAGDNRDKILAAYKKQMDALLKNQNASDPDAGAWRQVVDRTDAKPEMSCTAMFTFALATGFKNGWLTDAKYATAAKKGWEVLAKNTSSGMLAKVCPGTGQANAGDLASQQKFYMDIAFKDGDRHGQGPLLWAATALLRTDCPGKR